MKCPLTRTWANFISHRARRDISQCAPAHYFTFCGSKTFHYMHLCPQMQCLSRKKDEEFLQFFVLFLLVVASFFHTALSQARPHRASFSFCKTKTAIFARLEKAIADEGNTNKNQRKMLGGGGSRWSAQSLPLPIEWRRHITQREGIYRSRAL